MSIRFKMNKIVGSISENRNIFDFFIKVYIFGSSINNKHPNDIDLLLIYEDYKDILLLQNEKNDISLFLEKLLKLPVDITMLSERELEETRFLEKLASVYKKLK